MVEYSIKLDGFDELIKNLDDATKDTPNYIKMAMQEAVDDVASTARNEAPYKTGNLKRSINTKVENNGKSGIVYTDFLAAPYAIWQEIGTRYFKGRYYMQKGLENNQDKINKYFAKAGELIAKAITK